MKNRAQAPLFNLFLFLALALVCVIGTFNTCYCALPGADFSHIEPQIEEPGKQEGSGKIPGSPEEGYPGYLEGQHESPSQEETPVTTSTTGTGIILEPPAESAGSSSTVVTLPQESTSTTNQSTHITQTQEVLSESEQESLNKKIDDVLSGVDKATPEEISANFTRLSTQAHEVAKTDPKRAQDILAIQAKYATVIARAQYENLVEQLNSFNKNFSEQAGKAADLANQTVELASKLNDPTAGEQSEELFSKTLENIENAYNSALETANQLTTQIANLNTPIDVLIARETLLEPGIDVVTFYEGFDQRIKKAVRQLLPPATAAQLSGLISEEEGADFAEKLYNFFKSRSKTSEPSPYDPLFNFMQDPLVSTAFDMYSINSNSLHGALDSMENSLRQLTYSGSLGSRTLPHDMISLLKEAQQASIQEYDKAIRVKQTLDRYKEIYPALQNEQLYVLNRATNTIIGLSAPEALEQLLKNALTEDQAQTIDSSKTVLANASNSVDNLQALTFSKAMNSLHVTSEQLIRDLPKTQPSALQRFALWLKSFFSKAALNRLNTIQANREAVKNMKADQFKALEEQLDVQIAKLDTINRKLGETIVSNRPLEQQVIYTVYSITQANPIDDIARLESAYQAAAQSFQGSSQEAAKERLDASLQAAKGQLQTEAAQPA